MNGLMFIVVGLMTVAALCAWILVRGDKWRS